MWIKILGIPIYTFPFGSMAYHREEISKMANRTVWNSTLRSGKPPKKSPLKPRGKRWYRRKAAGLVYGPYHRHMATLPCLINDDAYWGDVSGHHVIAVGQGGQDFGNEVPLCTFHHICQLHAKGQPWFERHYNRDLTSIAEAIAEQYQGGAE